MSNTDAQDSGNSHTRSSTNASISAKDLVKASARSMLTRVPLSVWDRLFPKDVIGLCYHIVSDDPLPHAKFYDFKTSRQFEDDVIFLKDRYELVHFDQLLAEAESGEVTSPHNRFMITFDDGFAECHDVVRPILKKHDVPAAFFITTNFIDNLDLFFECKLALCSERIEKLTKDQAEQLAASLPLASDQRRPLTENDRRVVGSRQRGIDWQESWSDAHRDIIQWTCELFQSEEVLVDELCGMLGVDSLAYQKKHKPFMSVEQIQRMAADGFTIGAHTKSHANLNDLPLDEVERDIVESCSVIKDLTGQQKVPFAFPYNGANLERDFLADLQQRHSFVSLFFDTGELLPDAPFVINRIGADTPEKSQDGRSNLPHLLRKCWSKRSAWKNHI